MSTKARVVTVLMGWVILAIGCLGTNSPIFALTSSQADHSGDFYIDSIPEWVTPHQPLLEEVPLQELEVNFQCLLIDRQDNWQEKTTYIHMAVKPLTQLGIEGNSTVRIEFDPAYQKVFVHSIQVYRNGQWLDRLQCSRYEFIQDEEPSACSAYTGRTSLVYFLSDIRIGDIIDYSFTRFGEKPILHSHYAQLIDLQYFHPSAHISYSLLAPHDFSFSIKSFYTDALPLVEEISPSLKKWSWIIKNQKGFSREVDTPPWYDPSAYIACSQYSSWEEVSQLISALYVLPDIFEECISDEMTALVKEWQESASDIKERALLACRFVQDGIRYLSFTDGSRGLCPEEPRFVLQNRFGDCKGKSWLLHVLLRMMKIESTPLLVHSCKGQIIGEHLPSPLLFNHCIVQIKIEDSTYWVDPTLTLQGGSLDTNFYPDYTAGLLLFTKSDAFIDMPPFPLSKPSEFQTSILFLSNELALVKESSVFYGQEADAQRRSMTQEGRDCVQNKCLIEIEKLYGKVEVVSPLTFEDRREENVCTFYFSYQVPIEHLANTTSLDVQSCAISQYLDSNTTPTRKAPYQLVDPYWIKERIHIENPFYIWTPQETQLHHEHPSLVFSQTMHRSDHCIDYDIELRQPQDYVREEDLKSYWLIVKDIKRHAPRAIEIFD